MNIDLKVVLNNKILNKWRLFWVIAGPISIAMVIAKIGADLSSGKGVSALIQTSVRFAVPTLYLAFAASSVRLLNSGPLSLWLLPNRPIFGLCGGDGLAGFVHCVDDNSF